MARPLPRDRSAACQACAGRGEVLELACWDCAGSGEASIAGLLTVGDALLGFAIELRAEMPGHAGLAGLADVMEADGLWSYAELS